MKKVAKFVNRRRQARLSAACRPLDLLAVCEPLERRQLLSGVTGVTGVNFAAPVSYPIGGASFARTAADLNGDGIQDLVTANYNGTISVLLGNGNGTFKPAKTFSDGLSVKAAGSSDQTDLTVADLGNGHADILVSDEIGQNVSILLGNGDGTFKPPTLVPVIATGNVQALAVADLGNGRADLITSNNNGTISVLLGFGDGTFQSPQTVSIGGVNGSDESLAVADLNGDNFPDIIDSDNATGTLVVLFGNGDGTFTNPRTIAASGFAQVANFDGHADLLVRYDFGGVDVLLGNGDGTFKPAVPVLGGDYNQGGAFEADFNGDGKLDLFVGVPGTPSQILLGNGNGTFQTPMSGLTFSANANGAIIADLTGDGEADLVVAYGTPAKVGVLLNTTQSAPAITSANATAFGTGQVGSFAFTATGFPAPTFTETGNLPGGVTLNKSTGSLSGTPSGGYGKSYNITVSASNGVGSVAVQSFTLFVEQGISFSAATFYPVGASEQFPIRAADLTGDGRQDIVTDNYGSVSVLVGNGNGTLKPQHTFPDGLNSSGDGGTDDMALTDLGNGHPDILVSSGYSGDVSVLIGNGDGTFKAPALVLATDASTVYSIAVANLGNGEPDLVTTNGDGTISVMLGNGDGTFQAPQIINVGGGIGNFTVADINGDGNQDIVLVNQSAGSVMVLLGNGDGTFGPPQTIAAAGTNVSKLTVANFNGQADLVVVNDDGTVDLVLGNGDGTFQSPVLLLNAGSRKNGTLAEDVNGDGNLDLIVPVSGGKADVLLGNGNGTFQLPTPIAGIAVSSDVNADAEPDLNGDGEADFVFGYDNAAHVAVRLNTTTSAPIITSANSATFATGPAGTFLFTATGSPSPTFTETGALPTGVTLQTNGTLSGTPAAGTEKGYLLTISASNGIGTPAVQVFTLNVALGASFAAPANYNVGVPANAVAAVNLGNGHVDLVTENNNGTVSILIGNGNGTFKPATTISDGLASGNGGMDSLVVTDLGNGHPDIIVTGGYSGGAVSVLIGNGDGSFKAPTVLNANLSANGNFSSIVVADLGNGHPDIVAVGYAAEVFLGNGNGTFAAPTIYNNFGNYADSVAVADVTGDGIPDLLVAGKHLGYLEALVGIGGGVFQQIPITVNGPGIGSDVARVAVAELNVGNNQPDLVLQHESGTITMLSGNINGSFTLKQTLTTGVDSNNSGFLLGDVNGDGKPDLVFGVKQSNYSPNAQLTVFLGNGDGTFNPTGVMTFATNYPTSFAVTDVNGDGKADLITGYSGAVHVRLGVANFNGTFGAVHSYSTLNEQPTDVIVTGLIDQKNGNGANGSLDLVTANPDGTLSVLMGNGDGTFQQLETLQDGLGSGNATVVAATYNHLTDLIVENHSNKISLLRGNGDGSFQDAVTYGLNYSVRTITVADFNGDGIPDIATGNYDGSVSIFEGVNSGSGLSFNDPQQVPVATNTSVITILSDDFNDDGNADLIVGDANGAVFELLGLGGGEFQSPRQILTVPAGAYKIVQGDLNNDANTDLLVAQKNGTVNVLLGNGDGTFHAAPGAGLTVPNPIIGPVTLGDVNGDGRTDLVVANYYTSKVMVFLGNGNGTFQAAQNFAVPNGPAGAVVSDFNGDGKADIVTLEIKSGVIGVLLGNTAGAPSGFFNATVPMATGNRPTSVAVGSLVNGEMDVVVANQNDNDITIYRQGVSGTFVQSTYGGLTSPKSVAIADINGDGFMDIIVGNNNYTVSVFRNNGNGTFPSSPATYDLSPNQRGTPSGDNQIAVIDVLGNNEPSIVQTDSKYGEISVLHNCGNGAFAGVTAYSAGAGASGLAIGDVNGDHEPDIVVTNQYASSVSVLLNDGSGGFSPAQNFFAGEHPHGVTIGDVTGDDNADLVVSDSGGYYSGDGAAVAILVGNGDGTFKSPTTIELPGNGIGTVLEAPIGTDTHTDLIVASGYNGAPTDDIDILRGNGDGTFLQSFSYSVPAEPSGLATGDFNGDGQPDIVAAAEDSNELTFLLSANGPVFGGATSGTFTVGTLGTFTITASGGSTTKFTQTGLPSGLSLVNNNNGSATIRGTPAAGTGGTYNVSLSAQAGTGPVASEVFSLEVDQALVFTSPSKVTFNTGTPETFDVTTSGFPAAAYTEAGGLPFGVSLDPGGALGNQGSLDVEQGLGGIYTFTIFASNGVSPSPSQVFTLTLDDPATFTAFQTNTATFTAGTFGTFEILASGFPLPTFSETGAPSGVTFRADPAANQGGQTAAILSGIPGASTAGTYTITLSTSNAFGTAAETFSLTVDSLPAFTSAAKATFVVGTAETFNVTTSGFPDAALSTASTLPPGLSFVPNNNNGTAFLEGTPTGGAGTYKLALSADNGSTPIPTQTFILTVDQAPAITSSNSFTFETGENLTFPVTTTGFPTPKLTASGTFPLGMSFRDNLNGTGVFLGVPGAKTGGTYTILLTANNNVTPNAVQTFTLTVDQPPAIASAAKATFLVGTPQTFTITTTGMPTAAISDSGAGVTTLVADGLNFTDNHDGSATLTGTPAPDTGGSFSFSITANNGVATTSQLFTLTIDQPPAITSNVSATFITSNSGTFAVTTTGFPFPVITEKGTLPVGVAFRDNHNGTAVFVGTPGATTGNDYVFTISASNGVNPAATPQMFVLNVDQPAAIASTAPTTFTVGKAVSYGIKTSGFPTVVSISAAGLPNGLSLMDNGTGTGAIVGTPSPGDGGKYTVTLSPSNNFSNPAPKPQIFQLTIDEAPQVTTNNFSAFTVGTASTFTVNTTGFPVPTVSEIGPLPAGIRFTQSGGVGTFSGVPLALSGKTYAISVTASNGIGSIAKQTYTLVDDEAPKILPPATATFMVGKPGTFIVKSTGFPAGTFSLLNGGQAPSGLGFTDNHNGTYTLAGNPVPGTGSAYTVTINDTNGIGNPAMQVFTINVDEAPHIMITSNPAFTVGMPGTAMISATGFPAPQFLDAGILPMGISFHDNHDGTALVEGIPAAGTGRSYGLVLTAFNSISPTATDSFILTVDQALAITSTNHFTATTGVASTFTVKTSGFPLGTLSESGDSLAGTGLTFIANPNGTAMLAGKPNAGFGGTYNLTFTATNSDVNAANSATQTFTLVILPLPGASNRIQQDSSGVFVSSIALAAPVQPPPALDLSILTGGTYTIGIPVVTPPLDITSIQDLLRRSR